MGELAVETRTVFEVLPSGVGHRTITSECEPGEEPTGGGFTVGSIGDQDKVFASEPSGSGNGWSAQVINESGFDLDVWVHAQCARIGYPTP